jgi:hypothetical protein
MDHGGESDKPEYKNQFPQLNVMKPIKSIKIT